MIGFGKGFDFNLGPRPEVKIRLNLKQRKVLKFLLDLDLKIKAPSPPEAVCGLEGIRIGRDILKKRDKVGILIGGLAEEIWNRNRTIENLNSHKDVDILVLDPDNYTNIRKFEGGIDWWMPTVDSVEINDEKFKIYGLDPNYIERKFYRFINGNGVKLLFGIHQNYLLPPGLYIPSSEFIIDLRLTECETLITDDKLREAIDDSVREKFREHMRERIK